MTHVQEILANSVNLALSLVILIQILDLGRVLFREKSEVVTARLFFADQRFVRSSILLLTALIVFMVSNAFELYGDVVHIDWTVNEAIETASLVVLMASLFLLRRILGRASSRQPVARVHREGA